MSVIKIDLFFIELIREEPTIIVLKLFFLLLVRVVIFLDFLLSALFLTLRLFYKVVVTALRSVIVSNCSNLKLGSIRHSRHA